MGSGPGRTDGPVLCLSSRLRVKLMTTWASAMAHLSRQGRRVSRVVPYGFERAADGRSLWRKPHEQATVALIRRLAPGRSLRQLARDLAELVS